MSFLRRKLGRQVKLKAGTSLEICQTAKIKVFSKKLNFVFN